MQQYYYLVPWFPISVIGFLCAMLAGSSWGLIPHIYDVAAYMVTLYEQYGLIMLFLAAVFESLAYIGLYFPGAALLALIVMSSDGHPATFLLLSFIVAIAVTMGGLFSYCCGRNKYFVQYFSNNNTNIGRSTYTGFALSHWHANYIGLWYFKQGFKNQPVYPFVFITPVIAWIWGFIACFGLYALRNQAESDPLTIVFIALFIWLFTDVFLKYRHKQTFTIIDD